MAVQQPTQSSLRWHWSYLLWLLVPLAVWLVLREIPLGETLTALSRLHGWQIFVIIAINVLVLLAFTGGWWVILRAYGYQLNYLKLTQGRVGGFGVSYFVPGPQVGSETVQVLWAVKQFSVPAPVATASVALDKILEIMVNFTIVALGMLVIAQRGAIPQVAPVFWVTAGVALAALPIIFISAVYAGWAPLSPLLHRAPHWLAERPLFQKILHTVEESERLMMTFCREHRGSFTLALGLMALSWLLLLTDYWLGAHFLGMALSVEEVLMGVTLGRLALLIPLPGAAGALEGSQVLALTALGFSPALGLAQSLIMRARDISVALFGLIWMLGGQWLANRLRRFTPP